MRKSLNFIFLVTCALVLPANGAVKAQSPNAGQDQGAEIERAFDRALQRHQAGDLEGAVKEYQTYLAARPDQVEARSNLGAVYARLGRYQDAIEQYQKALAVDPKNSSVRFNLAVAFYKAARFPQAAAELAVVIAGDKANTNAVLLLADCHLRADENKKVIDLLAPLQASRPDDRALAYLLGTALIRDNQVERGQKAIDPILRDGESAESRLLLAMAKMMALEFAEAQKDLARAAEINPKLPSVHAYYGRALLALGDQDRAKTEFLKELENNPHDFDANLNLGVLFKQEQKHEESFVYLRHALSLRPGALEVRYQIATLLLATGKVTEAQQTLEEVVKEAPNFVEAHVTLATVYYRLKRKADGDAERAIVQRLNAEAQSRAPGAQQQGGSEKTLGTIDAQPPTARPE